MSIDPRLNSMTKIVYTSCFLETGAHLSVVAIKIWNIRPRFSDISVKMRPRDIQWRWLVGMDRKGLQIVCKYD